jgi:tetratricopeptide (TPR) repeat protein
MVKRIALIIFIVVFGMVWVAGAQEEEPTGTQQTSAPIVVAPELLQRAAASYDESNFERAALDYSLFLLLNPTISEAYYYRALTYVGMGDYDTALEDVSEALALEPASPDYVAELYLLRAQLHLQKEDTTSALTDLDASIEASPELVDNLVTRARVYAFQERYADAIADFDRVLEISPENTDVLIDRAFAHYELSNFDSALSDMTTAINLNPQDGGLYLLRGAINSQADHVEDAASDYLHWIESVQTRENNAADTLTTSQQFVIAMTEGAVYHIPFQAEAGQRINVTANRNSDGQVDPLVVIIDNGGEALVADDDSGGNMDASIEGFVIPRDGEYTLVVGHALGGAEGDILVSLDLNDN